MTFNYEDNDHTPRRRKQRRDGVPLLFRLNSILGFIFIVVLIICVGITFVPIWNKRRDMRNNLAALEHARTVKTADLRKTQQQLDLLRSDPEYLETIARDRLNLMKPGETVFRVELPPIATSVHH